MRKPITAIVLSLVLSSTSQAVPFDIELNFLGGLTASQQAIFATAETTWESLVLSYKDSWVPTGTKLKIDAKGEAIDGVGGTLGFAGPTTGIASGSGNYLYAKSGEMTFDLADLGALESGGSLLNVILHEMAHVMGIGTLWSSSGVGIPGFQELYVAGSGEYTGANALAAYNAEFSQTGTFVPVELGGGGGTANAHWNEVNGGGGLTGITDSLGRDSSKMLMTGWLNSGSFISDTTLGSFEDLGYNTSLSAVPESMFTLPVLFLVLVGLFTGSLRMRHR